MAQELWNRGYYVQVNLNRRSRPRSGTGNGKDHFMSIDAIVHRDDELDLYKLAELHSDGEHYTFGFY